MLTLFPGRIARALPWALALVLAQATWAFAQDLSLVEVAAISGTDRPLLTTENLPAAPEPAADLIEPVKLAAIAPVGQPPAATLPEPGNHPFWDRPNRLLFVATGATATADFFVTHSNLSRGGRELNPVTRVFGRSSAGLATNFTLETAGVMGVSYLLHRTGHHRLERMTSLVNIGGSAGAVAYGLTHR